MSGLYSIAHGDARATVSTLGGNIIRYSVGGRDIIYPYEKGRNKARVGFPMCAPWFGSSPRGTKKHGFLRDMEAKKSNTDSETFVELDFAPHYSPSYSWAVGYSTKAHLKDDGTLQMSLRVFREEDGIAADAPVNLAFHPYFALPEGRSAKDVQVFVGGDAHAGFSIDAKLIPLKSKQIAIFIPNEIVILMELGGDFTQYGQSQLAFWTDAPDKYFCVEPILCAPSLFDTPQGHCLEMGQSIEIKASISLL